MNDFPVPQFYENYIGLVGQESIVELLLKNREETLEVFTDIPDLKWHYRYDTGKWSVQEVLQHITDTERVMTYRALRFARNDKTELPGFEQDDYVHALMIGHLGRNAMLEEWRSVRDASVIFFRNLDPALLTREGIAGGNKLNVELLGKIIAGHTRHHLKILRERYLI